MTKAQEGLVERIVVGPKPIWGKDKNGERKCYNVGDTIWLPPHQAKSKARYLQSPEVAEAQAVVAAAEAPPAEAEGGDSSAES